MYLPAKSCGRGFQAGTCLSILLACAGAAAQSADEEQLALACGGKSSFNIVTGNRQAVVRSPTFAPENIPFDLQQPGRGCYLQFRHKL